MMEKKRHETCASSVVEEKTMTKAKAKEGRRREGGGF